MRLGKFEAGNHQPIGEGEERATYINPQNEERIISVLHNQEKNETTRQLKGRYYLTQIAHLLLPHHIPTVHQAAEDEDGVQTIDRPRVEHTTGHAALQEARRQGEDEEDAGDLMLDEMGKDIQDVDLALEGIGLSFNIDSNLGNYTRDSSGNVQYLESFQPWRVYPDDPTELEVLFEEEEMRAAIEKVKDEDVQKKCTRLLDRLMILFSEEEREVKTRHQEQLVEAAPHVAELESLLEPFMTEEMLATLNAVETEEEAMSSEDRTVARQALTPIFALLKFIGNQTNVPAETYGHLYDAFQTLSRAVGTINRGRVDHDM